MRRHPRRAQVDRSHPKAWGTSDHSGFIGQHADMKWQYEWAGFELINKRILVFEDELDKPQRQLGSIIIPPDPPTIINARPEQYAIEETPVTSRQTINNKTRITVGHPVYSVRIIAGNPNTRGSP